MNPRDKSVKAGGTAIDFAALRLSIDLRRFVEDDLGPPLKGGRWPCPIHGGDGPNFSVNGGRWKCWSCGASGDVIDYLARREGITVAEAASRLDPSGFGPRRAGRRTGLTPSPLNPSPRALTPTRPAAPPAVGSCGPGDRGEDVPTWQDPEWQAAVDAIGEDVPTWQDPEWQAAVDAIVRRADAVLWSRAGRPALDWLRARGLLDATIRRFRLGFLPSPVSSEPVDALGRDERGEPRRVRAVRGVVIPWLCPGGWHDPADDGPGGSCPRWVGCNVRRLPPVDLSGPLPGGVGKYHALAGSERGHGYPWPDAGAPGQPALVVEGEFDGLIGWQEAGWVANVVTFGGAGQTQPHPDACAFLAACPDWLLLFDSDDAGDKAAREMARRSRHRCRRLYLPPGVNDLTDLHKTGGSVLGWLREEYGRFGWAWPGRSCRPGAAEGDAEVRPPG